MFCNCFFFLLTKVKNSNFKYNQFEVKRVKCCVSGGALMLCAVYIQYESWDRLSLREKSDGNSGCNSENKAQKVAPAG